MHQQIPNHIQAAGLLIRELSQKKVLNNLERESLNQAKLKVAFWACGSEQVIPSRENLVYVLGGDAPEIMTAYDQAQKRDALKERRKTGHRIGDKAAFWGDVHENP